MFFTARRPFVIDLLEVEVAAERFVQVLHRLVQLGISIKSVRERQKFGLPISDSDPASMPAAWHGGIAGTDAEGKFC
jgi:hypothetical protein